MRLVPHWRRVLARAWSVRLNLLAALLGGCEVAIQLVGYALPIPPLWLGGLAVALTLASTIARLVAQKGVTSDR